MKFNIMTRVFSTPTAWNGEVVSPIEISLHVALDIKGLYFIAKIPNKSFISVNPLTAMSDALESATVGDIKYLRLKERIRTRGLWRDCDD